MTTCECGARIYPRFKYCNDCRLRKRRESDAHYNEAQRQKRIAAKTQPTCMDCDRPVLRHGARCHQHSRARKAIVLRAWREKHPEQAQGTPVIDRHNIYVTPEMRRACPLSEELWRTIAPQAPHLDWGTL